MSLRLSPFCAWALAFERRVGDVVQGALVLASGFRVQVEGFDVLTDGVVRRGDLVGEVDLRVGRADGEPVVGLHRVDDFGQRAGGVADGVRSGAERFGEDVVGAGRFLRVVGGLAGRVCSRQERSCLVDACLGGFFFGLREVGRRDLAFLVAVLELSEAVGHNPVLVAGKQAALVCELGAVGVKLLVDFVDGGLLALDGFDIRAVFDADLVDGLPHVVVAGDETTEPVVGDPRAGRVGQRLLVVLRGGGPLLQGVRQLRGPLLGFLLFGDERSEDRRCRSDRDAPRAAEQVDDAAAYSLEPSGLQLRLGRGRAERLHLFGSAHRGRLEHLECGLRGSQRGFDSLDRVYRKPDVVGHGAGAAVEIACGLVHRAEHARK